jgi:hypothetical protein
MFQKIKKTQFFLMIRSIKKIKIQKKKIINKTDQTKVKSYNCTRSVAFIVIVENYQK